MEAGILDRSTREAKSLLETNLPEVISILSRTPAVLSALLLDLPDRWLSATEGPETFSPRDVLGHLIHAEQTDWIPRLQMILKSGESEPFPPFDRVGFKELVEGASLASLLSDFQTLRGQSLATLRAADLRSEDLSRLGRHPDFGPVTLGQLLATWAVHDLNHTAQIVRVLSKNYSDAVGPWKQYLGILSR